ncbi:DNA-3-methyladenine glycosylase [Bifidobacterium sp.]|jgi:DNA-3-methyladenine glycosylase|uniref:DNA-3-methyladenine glycosylase n=1 Tax=Bifidobacterium sp. TaxID=41200 RepID=UPI0025BF33F1|nr:DNA-3-methyladenine glycosylase [Bifidobacterium sp.]MCH4209447.1 DNA-3-methyladenine glycosylase [Bifidobacterium sp.]
MAGVFPQFLDQGADAAARALLGCHIVRILDGVRIVVRIVETEAYDQLDPASHTFHGKSERNRAMFGPAGHAYIYFTYGMHYCLNVTAAAEGFGAGALIRAVEPVEGAEIIERRRERTGVDCTNGPAKLCKALGIDKALYGHDLRLPPLSLEQAELRPSERIAATPRIGISKAAERQRRFIIPGNPYLSHGPMWTKPPADGAISIA